MAKQKQKATAATPEIYAADLAIECPDRLCKVPAGMACIGLEPGIVHFGRRLKRILIGRGQVTA